MVSTSLPSSRDLFISSQRAIKFKKHDLNMVKPHWLFQITFSFTCPETNSKRICPTILLGTKNEAEQPIVPWIILLALFEKGCSICLFPVIMDLPWSLWPFKESREQPHNDLSQLFQHPSYVSHWVPRTSMAQEFSQEVPDLALSHYH